MNLPSQPPGEVLNTLLGEDDGDTLSRPEKDEDLLHLKQDDDLRCQKLENLEGPARVVLDCQGSWCPRTTSGEVLDTSNNQMML